MDELKFNKVFAGVLLAALLLMAGIKAGQILVPLIMATVMAQTLHNTAYPIEVPEVADTSGSRGRSACWARANFGIIGRSGYRRWYEAGKEMYSLSRL